MLNSIIGLLEVHKAGVQRTLGEQRMVDEMPQGEQVVGSGLAGSETSLCRAAEAMLFSPTHQAVIEDGGVELALGPIAVGEPRWAS